MVVVWGSSVSLRLEMGEDAVARSKMAEPMTELVHESWVVFHNAAQVETRAVLKRFDRHQVVFEHYTLDSLLRTSEVLADLKILFQGTVLYSGRALVRSLVNTGPTVICEATLDDEWMDLPAAEGASTASLLERYHEFFQAHQKFHYIRPEYTAAVAGLRNYLGDVRLWLDHVALGLPVVKGKDRPQVERDAAWKLREPIVQTIGDLFDRYEHVAQQVPEELQPAYYAYGQRQVRRLLLDAPFVFRTFRKPLGYAGDYRMVAMMFGDPCEGPSLFGRILNCYSLGLPPIRAHRNRVDYLAGRLEQEALRAMRQDRRLRVFNLGCGPAREVRQFIESSACADHAEFQLVDFNQETLDEAKQQLETARSDHGRRTALQFLRKSVQQILKESARRRAAGQVVQFDLVYCAGLFDYLSDSICKHMVDIFWEMVAPGGLLIVTNVDQHPSRAQMECFLEWNLVYRDTAGMRRLVPASAPADEVVLKRDPTGVNIFLELRKPDHGH